MERLPPTKAVLLTDTMQTIYTVPADAEAGVVMNIHASNSGGSSAQSQLTMLVAGRSFYEGFPVGNTLDRDTYLILGPGQKIEAKAQANNAISLFVTVSERLVP